MKLRELIKLAIDNAVDLDTEVMVDVDGKSIPTWGIQTGTFPHGPPRAGLSDKWIIIKGTAAWGLDGRVFV